MERFSLAPFYRLWQAGLDLAPILFENLGQKTILILPAALLDILAKFFCPIQYLKVTGKHCSRCYLEFEPAVGTFNEATIL